MQVLTSGVDDLTIIIHTTLKGHSIIVSKGVKMMGPSYLRITHVDGRIVTSCVTTCAFTPYNNNEMK